jgi:hypothetical protein
MQDGFFSSVFYSGVDSPIGVSDWLLRCAVVGEQAAAAVATAAAAAAVITERD